jgi:ATP-dependent Lon protease
VLIEATSIPSVMPVLPLRNSVFFPGGVLPLAIGRPKSIALIEDASRDDLLIAILTQRRAEDEDPAPADLYGTGTASRIVKVLKKAENNYGIVVQGLARLRVLEFVRQTPYLQARVEHVGDPPGANSVEVDALAIELRKVTRQVIELMPELPTAASELVESITHPGHLADLIAMNVDIPIEHKQSVLDTADLIKRMRIVVDIVALKREILLRTHQIEEGLKPAAERGGLAYAIAGLIGTLVRQRRSAASGARPSFETVSDTASGELRCSFCGAPQEPARFLLRGGPAAICEACLASAAEALAAHLLKPPTL